MKYSIIKESRAVSAQVTWCQISPSHGENRGSIPRGLASSFRGLAQIDAILSTIPQVSAFIFLRTAAPSNGALATCWMACQGIGNYCSASPLSAKRWCQ